MSSHVLILIAIAMIVLLGPTKLPQLGRGLGDAIRGFKKGMAGEDDDEIDVTHSTREKLKEGEPSESVSQKQSHKDKA